MSLKIYRALKSPWLGQKFGDSKACCKWSITSNRPVMPWVIVAKNSAGLCPPGYKSFYEEGLKQKGHNGQDWTAYFREPIYFNVVADTEWQVLERGEDLGYGKYLEIRSLSPVLDGKHVKFIYVHAHKNLAPVGSKVVAGQHIQEANSTGASSGHHLHFGMKFCDEDGNTLNGNNGYSGYIDPAPWTDGQSVTDFLGFRQRLTLSLQLSQLQLQLLYLLQSLRTRIGALLN